MQANFKI